MFLFVCYAENAENVYYCLVNKYVNLRKNPLSPVQHCPADNDHQIKVTNQQVLLLFLVNTKAFNLQNISFLIESETSNCLFECQMIKRFFVYNERVIM